MTEVLKSGFVSVIGRPNVGKSTFCNRVLATQLSAISNRPQTTWHQIRGIHTDARGQIIFVDTPGIHRAASNMNQAMVANAVAAMNEADVILLLLEATGLRKMDYVFLDALRDNPKLVIAVNKMDAVSSDKLESVAQQLQGLTCPLIYMSALTGEGLGELEAKLFERLPEGPLLYDAEQATDRSTRFVVTEYIRQALFEELKEELPYEAFVEIDDFAEKARPIKIEATIYVARKTQKQIVIGTGGKQLKRIGIRARGLIEELLGQQVYLHLWVKVLHKWNKNENALRRAGVLMSGKKQQSAMRKAVALNLWDEEPSRD